MPPKRTTRQTKTKKKPSISDLFHISYNEQDEENDSIQNEISLSFSLNDTSLEGKSSTEKENVDEMEDVGIAGESDDIAVKSQVEFPKENADEKQKPIDLNDELKQESLDKLNEKIGSDADLLNNGGIMTLPTSDVKNMTESPNVSSVKPSENLSNNVSKLSTQEFVESLISSSLFPRPQLEESMMDYMKTGKKRDYFERELDNLKEKIDMYKADTRNDALISEIIGAIQEMNFDGNITLLAKFFGKNEKEILDFFTKRKKMRRSLSDEKFAELEKEYFARNNALELLFRPKNNIFSTLPAELADSMIVTLQFLIYNNEFIIQYGNQQQICHYNTITRSFLQEIASGILPAGLMESLEFLPQVKYYNGSLLVEIRDHRSKLSLSDDVQNNSYQVNRNSSPLKTTKLLLSPRTSTAFEHVKRYLDENFQNASEEEKLEALQGFMVTMNPKLDLEPDTSILHKQNAIHYNQKKHIFRRLVTRTISRTLMPSNPAQTSMTIQSSMMRTRKQDHVLLNYIANNGWKKDRITDIDAKPRRSVQPKPGFMQQLIEESDESKKGLSVKSPLHLLQEASDLSREQRKVVRILQFQAVQQTPDQKRKWQVEVFPAHKGRRYDCVIIPSVEPIPRWTIGSKHAAELYCERLKDMFTSNGKTFCSTDMEVDYAQWEEKRKVPQSSIPQNMQSQSTMPPTTQLTAPTPDRQSKLGPGPSPQSQSYVQIRNNTRVQNGQMQNIPYNIMHAPPNQGLQGNIHAQHLHQVINQQQRKQQQ